MIQGIKKFLNDDEVRKKYEEYMELVSYSLYKLDGKASERVARLIERMIDENCQTQIESSKLFERNF